MIVSLTTASMTTPTGSRSCARDRKGIALVMALGAIVVIGALVAGAFHMSTRDLRTGRSAQDQEHAQLAAEYALYQARDSVDLNKPSDLAVGGVRSYTITDPANAGTQIIARITRASDEIFVLNTSAQTGTDIGGGSGRPQRRASMVFVLRAPTMNFPGALTVNGAIQIAGTSEIKGTDAPPTGWGGCAANKPTKPGLVIEPGANTTFSGNCANQACIEGDPKTLVSPLAGDTATYTQFGSVNWPEMVANATLRLPAGNYRPAPSLSGGLCNKANLENWGEPLRPGNACNNYFPIIYINGDATLNGVRGQGILLVNGDLNVQGGFEFFGPVIVQGRLKTAGTGGHFNGGVLARNFDDETNMVVGDAVVQYSSCAIETAIKNSSPVVPIVRRAWADLF